MAVVFWQVLSRYLLSKYRLVPMRLEQFLLELQKRLLALLALALLRAQPSLLAFMVLSPPPNIYSPVSPWVWLPLVL
jgi:hypothetical protein